MNWHVPNAWVPGAELGDAPCWAPDLFCGPAATVLAAAHRGRSVQELGGQVIEGWRVSELKGTAAYDPRVHEAPVYRPADIGILRLLPRDEHWAPPAFEEPWCVQPGDVVVPKFAPFRAAWVTARAHRHPVDGNCLLVRGLPSATAVWLALCLNRAEYQAILLREAGSGVLPRVGVAGLRALRVPPPPPELAELAIALGAWLDEELDNAAELARLRREVDDLVAEAAGEIDPPAPLCPGLFTPPAVLDCENWRPVALALRAEQRALDVEAGWCTLAEVAVRRADRSRLEPAAATLGLRLGDVGDDLLVPRQLSPVPAGQEARYLAEVLAAGDVLLSLLVSNPRAAFLDDGLPGGVHPVEHWLRLRCQETPAAWALVLGTPRVRSQLTRMAVGSVLQFTTPAQLLTLRLPRLPGAVRERWQRGVERHHQRSRAGELAWPRLAQEADRLFRQAHLLYRGGHRFGEASP